MSFVAVIEADIDKWGPNLNKAERDVNNFATKAKQDFDKLAEAQKRSSSVAMEFNRIIQDAPFGMMGIGNNITQLSDNYKNYAQSVRAAAAEQGKSISNFQILKGVIGGIFSPLNLFSLGIATVTSAWTFYTMWSQKANKATKENKEATETFATTLKKYASELDSVNKSRIDAQKTTSQEIASLTTLRGVIENESLSRDKRLKAVEKLKSQYPSYFKDISNEQLLIGNSVSLYQKLTKEIIATGIAMASQRAMGEEYENIANSTLRRQKSLEVINKLENENAKLAPKLKDVFPDIRLDNIGAFTEWEKSVIGTRSLKQMKEAGVELNVVRKNLAAIHQENILQFKDQQNIAGSQSNLKILNDQVNQSLVEGANITGDYTVAKTEQTKAEKDYKRELIESLGSLGYYDAALASIGYKYKDLSKLALQAGADAQTFDRLTREQTGEKLALYLDNILNQKDLTNRVKTEKSIIADFKIDPKITYDIPKLTENLKSLQSNIKAPLIDFGKSLGEQMNEAINSGLANGISSVMSALGDSIASGDNALQAAGSALLGSFGSIMVDLGKMAVASGIAIEAVKKSLMTLGPFAIPAGLALIAIGSVFASSASKIGKSMGSSTSASSGSYGSSISSTANAMPNHFQGAYSNDNTVVFEIEGDKLRGVLDKIDRKNKRTR